MLLEGSVRCTTNGPVGAVPMFFTVTVAVVMTDRTGRPGDQGEVLAALAVLDGLSPEAAVAWVRGRYHRRPVEAPWQRRWLRHVAAS